MWFLVPIIAGIGGYFGWQAKTGVDNLAVTPPTSSGLSLYQMLSLAVGAFAFYEIYKIIKKAV